MNYEDDIHEYYAEQEEKNAELYNCLKYLIFVGLIAGLLILAGWFLWELIK